MRGTGRVSGKPGATARSSGSRSRTSESAAQGAERFSGSVVLFFIFASTVIALHDLYLVLTLLAR